jgi:hypothetical protein
MGSTVVDRWRDRLYFAFARFHQRAEVVDAVRRGRAVSDPELAPAAVERARMLQEHEGRFFWVASSGTVVSLCLVFLGVAVVFAVEGNWVVAALFVAEAVVWPVVYSRGTQKLMTQARRAEKANEKLARSTEA